MSSDLIEAKQRLLDKLGPNYDIYIQLLGKWFRGLMSKDEFEKSAKKLIQQNFVLEHNKFCLGFFHHCANNANSTISTAAQSQKLNYNSNNSTNCYDYSQQQYYDSDNHLINQNSIDGSINSPSPSNFMPNPNLQKCLPNKMMTHMKVFVIAWEMGLDSADDQVSIYVNLALRHFLKNIITELITSKTAYRLRENKFKYAIGVKPINPYLNNSLKIYSSNLEYDPYQIESNKMNSSLVDTYAYNDSLFPSRLYEAQALYEYACSTTSVVSQTKKDKSNGEHIRRLKKIKYENDCEKTIDKTNCDVSPDEKTEHIANDESLSSDEEAMERRLTLFDLLIAFLSNKSIMPHDLYSINLERIFTKLSC